MSSELDQHYLAFDAQSTLVVICSSLGLYNALELILLIFTTFKHYSGLYFWSILIASFGVIPYTIGWLIVYFRLSYNWLGFAFSTYGWVTMVTGQSVVLYSRLHLVLNSPKILRAVKWMIIVDAVVFHTTTTVVHYGSAYGGEQARFKAAWNIVEKIQMSFFCIQEFILSGLYLWKAAELLQVVQRQGTKRVMWRLAVINVLIIVMDIALLGLEYRSLHVLEQAFKVVIYSIKLKLEFAILNQLVDIVHHHNNNNTEQDLGLTFSSSENNQDCIVGRDATTKTKTITDDPESQPTKPDPHTIQKNSPPKKSWWSTNGGGTTPSPSIQHVENANPESISSNPHNLLDSPSSVRVQSIDNNTRSSITRFPSSANRNRSESDLMYAEMMRSISAKS